MMRFVMWLMLAACVLCVVTLVGLADSGRARHFFTWVASFPAGDKFGHVFLYGALAFFANAALSGSRYRLGTLALLKGSVLVVIPTVLEECSQIWFPYRTFDLWDLFADGVGILLGGWLAVLLLRRLGKLQPREPKAAEGDAVA